MFIEDTGNGVLLRVRVKTNSSRFCLRKSEHGLILEVTSPPKEGRANQEIIKGFRRFFGKNVDILRGFGKREKLILVKNVSKEEIEQILI